MQRAPRCKRTMRLWVRFVKPLRNPCTGQSPHRDPTSRTSVARAAEGGSERLCAPGRRCLPERRSVLSRAWSAQQDAEDKRVRNEQQRNQYRGNEVRGPLKARSETYAGTIPLVKGEQEIEC